jgi:hypothetical protein
MTFDYAISFSSSERDLARKLSEELTSKGYKIFFDEDFEHELLGKDGADYLNNIFFRQSKYCITILSKTYEKSAWTQLERRAIQAREFETEPGYLIPILIDGFRPDWLLPTRIYFDLNKRGWDRLVELLCKKVQLDYFGPFKITKEIQDFSDIRALSISATDIDNEYIIWSGYVEGEPFELHRLKKDKEGNWLHEPINIKDRGRYLFLNKNILIASSQFGDEPINIHHIDTKTNERFILSRNAKWRSITDCKFDGNNIYFSFCGGGGWIYSLSDKKSICIQNDEDHTQYAKVSLVGDGKVIIGVGEEISIYSQEGKLLEKFDSPDYIESMAYNNLTNQIVVGGGRHLHFVDINTKGVKFQHPLTASTAFELESATESSLVICISGFPRTSNVLEIIDSKTKLCFGQIDSGRYKTWWNIAISKDGNSFIGLITNDNFYNPENKLVIFERQK